MSHHRTITFLGLLLVPAVAHAGMPNIRLTDVAELRLQSLSFFFVIFLLSSWLVQHLWNYLGKDFTSLPHLTYCKALGLVSLWGLLFVLVLTMISGARELMTPGAWVKKGATYQLAPGDRPAPKTEEPLTDDTREQKLVKLRSALWQYAEAHQACFPAEGYTSEVPAECWQLPKMPEMRYVYVAGLRTDEGAHPLAYEPGVYGSRRWVLLTDGTVKQLEMDELRPLLTRRK